MHISKNVHFINDFCFSVYVKVKCNLIIPEIKLTPTQNSKEAKNAIGFKWNKVAEFRHKLGSEPDGISPENYPNCKECTERMTFMHT